MTDFPKFLNLAALGRDGCSERYTRPSSTTEKSGWQSTGVSATSGFFPSLDQAYDAGRRHYGPGVFFLVMRVVDYDQLAVVSSAAVYTPWKADVNGGVP